MLRCLAIDDEPLALDLLEDNISRVPFLEMAGKLTSAIEAVSFLKENPVDLIFLDIQMPGLTGLQFIRGLVQKPMIILVTAYEKFALDGFNLDVIDYLVKPVSLERFIKASNKAWELYQLKNKPADNETTPDHFFVNMEYSLHKVEFGNILWIEGLRDYIKINVKNSSKPIITRMSMKAMEDLLPASKFVRIHKSYIMSIASVTSLRKNSVFVDSREFPIGESYKNVIPVLIGKAG